MASSNVVNENGTDETNKEQENLENWLPVTASREAKWWYATFHNVTAMVGAGVLGLPYAVSQLGWIPGVAALLFSWLITFYSLWQLVEMHELVPGKRFDRYFQLGQHAFGSKLGYWVVMPQQLTVQIACCIVYCVTGGKSLKKFFDLLIPSMSGARETSYILFFIALQLVLSQTPNFNELKSVSLLAAVMSFCYSLVAFIASIVKGTHHLPRAYGVRSQTSIGKMFDIFNGLGTIAFAFAGHSVALEIQATLPSSQQNPSKKAMWRGVFVAYCIVIACYLTVAISGYWAFGAMVEDDVLISLEHPFWLIAVANLMVFFHVMGSFQVFGMPVFDTIESILINKYHFTASRTLRIFGRSVFVVVVGFIGLCIPFFGGLLGFFGGLAFTSTAYFLPCIIWIIVKRPKRWSAHWILSVICIIIGVLIAVLAPIGGVRTIVLSAKTYKMFS